METRKKIPALQLRSEFDVSTIDKEKRTVEVVFSTGSKGRRDPWFGESYLEELSLDPEHVRLDFLNSGIAPVLANHSRWELRDVIGVVEKAWLTKTEARALLRFSDRASMEDTWRDIENGILRGISVGYRVHTYERHAPEGDEKLPVYRAIDWEPKEISIVPIGFDEKAMTRADEQSEHECVLINRHADTGGKEKTMEPTKNTPAQAPAADLEAQRQAAELAERTERERGLEIRKSCKATGLPEEFAEQLVKDGIKIEEARAMIINEVAKRNAGPEISNKAPITAGDQDEVQTRRLAMEEAILHRSDAFRHQMTDRGRRFRGMSLVRMAEEALGSQARGLTASELVSRAMTSSDFPLILGNVAEKMLMAAYKTQTRTFDPIVGKGTLVDYKPAKRYQVGDSPELKEMLEGAPYTLGSFGEKAEAIQLADYGRKLKFTRQMIINDDLQAFQRVIGNFGASASRLLSKLVWAILDGNPTLSDNIALFHADHGNLGTGAAITETSLGGLEKLMMDQKTLDGQDFMGVVAKFLFCGTAKKVEAQKILANITAGKSGDVNPFQGAYTLIVDPRITGNKWGLIADPNDIVTIEVAHLEGENGPVIDSKEDFDTDGLEVKCRHTVAVKALEHRGVARNPGN